MGVGFVDLIEFLVKIAKRHNFYMYFYEGLVLYHLSLYLKPYISVCNVLHYVSVRAILGLLGSLIFSAIFGGWFIETSRKFFTSKSREFTPAAHRAKDNMPTMGGLFMLAVIIINTLLWCDLKDAHVWVMILALVLFGAIGWWDDWSKITKRKGITALAKFCSQWTAALLVIGAWLLFCRGASTELWLPFFKNIHPNLGVFFIPWAMFVMVSMSNAVNLTDGLDGLAIVSLMPNFSLFGLISYLSGHYLVSLYLHIPFAATSEIAVIGAILVGTSLGFLWYNAYPAEIFMGDVGALSLGAALALMGIMSKQELLLPIAGGLFVLETLSVMIQIGSYRYLGRRLFRMAPIHHHFELLGLPESKITVRFGIISLILCLLALITLKLR